MKKTQMSTNAGIVSIFGGFLNIFGNTQITSFMEVFVNLTFSQLAGMVLPIIGGVWAILHDEKSDIY